MLRLGSLLRRGSQQKPEVDGLVKSQWVPGRHLLGQLSVSSIFVFLALSLSLSLSFRLVFLKVRPILEALDSPSPAAMVKLRETPDLGAFTADAFRRRMRCSAWRERSSVRFQASWHYRQLPPQLRLAARAGASARRESSVIEATLTAGLGLLVTSVYCMCLCVYTYI